jgi:hypothetical protein
VPFMLWHSATALAVIATGIIVINRNSGYTIELCNNFNSQSIVGISEHRVT